MDSRKHGFVTATERLARFDSLIAGANAPGGEGPRSINVSWGKTLSSDNIGRKPDR
jgi:hypothetical protein